MRKPITESEEFRRGRAGELIVADWLKRRGCYVIPSYDYSGQDGNKAPRLQGLWKGHPVPDLDVCKNGGRFWVEVKTKAEPNLFRITGVLEHGIELHLAQHYRTVELLSGCPAWLFIYEEGSHWLLGQRFAALAQSRIGTYNGTRMINWPRRLFRELEQISATDWNRT